MENEFIKKRNEFFEGRIKNGTKEHKLQVYLIKSNEATANKLITSIEESAESANKLKNKVVCLNKILTVATVIAALATVIAALSTFKQVFL